MRIFTDSKHFIKIIISTAGSKYNNTRSWRQLPKRIFQMIAMAPVNNNSRF